MGFGYVIGGAAKGLQAADTSNIQHRALDLKAQALGADVGLRDKAISIREQQLKDAQSRNLGTEADKIIAQELKVVADIVKHSQQAGHTPDQINKAIEPLMADIDSLSKGVGRDSSMIRTRVQGIIGAPMGQEAAKVGGTVEGLKAKLAAGQQLTPGEQKVYDDAQRMSLFDRMLLGGQEPGATATPSAGAAPAPAPTTLSAPSAAPAPQTATSTPQSQGPLPFEAVPQKRQIGQVYSLPNGKQALWTQDAKGNVGWELLQ